MKKLYPDLWQTELEHPFSGLNTHAYFLQRDQGNVLFYNTSHEFELQNIKDRGGITYQYLSHRHEAGPILQTIKETFQSKLCTHTHEKPFIEKHAQVDITFDQQTTHNEDILILPTPGHTDGGLCCFYRSPHGKSYLFTGDTYFQSYGNWDTLVFPSEGGSKDALIQSLTLLGSFSPDVVLCSASVGDVSVVETTHEEWKKNIEESIKKLSN